MKHLAYAHQQNVALICAMHRWIRRTVAGLFLPRQRPATEARRRSSWLPLAVLLISLVAQAVLLWMLGEVIDLCVSLMEVWAELARKHLELTS